MEDFYPNYYLEKFLTFIIPLSFVITFQFLLMDFKIDFIQSEIHLYFSMGITAVIQFFICLILQMFTHVKSGISVHIRSIIILLIIELTLCYFLGLLNEPYLLVPCTFFQYFISAVIHVVWINHLAVCDQCMDKSGKELISELFHYNDRAVSFEEKVKKAITVILFISLIFLLGLSLSSSAKVQLSIFTFISVIFYTISVLFLLIIFELYRKHIYYSFLGFNTVLDRKPLIIRKSFKIIIILSILAALISPGKTYIKINPPQIKHQEKVDVQPKPEIIETPSTPVQTPEDFRIELEPNKSSKMPQILPIIFQIIKYLCIICFITGIIVFLLGPVFTEDFRDLFKKKKFLLLFKDYINKLKDFFRYIFTKTPVESQYKTVNSKSFKKFLDDFIKNSNKSKEKKEELDKLSKAFMTLISWGKNKNIRYTKNLAPAEYTKLISNFFEQNNNMEAKKTATNCGFLFEKALYSNELLGLQEQEDFFTSINELTAL